MCLVSIITDPKNTYRNVDQLIVGGKYLIKQIDERPCNYDLANKQILYVYEICVDIGGRRA